MFRNFVLGFFLTALIGCNGGSDGVSGASIENIWWYTTECTYGTWEGLRFYEPSETDGFSSSSYQENTYGIYEVNYGGARPLVSITITDEWSRSTNSGTDCWGSSVDNTGEVVSFYYEVTSDRLRIYDTAVGSVPLITYKKSDSTWLTWGWDWDPDS
jgi:hypothetical protein